MLVPNEMKTQDVEKYKNGGIQVPLRRSDQISRLYHASFFEES